MSISAKGETAALISAFRFEWLGASGASGICKAAKSRNAMAQRRGKQQDGCTQRVPLGARASQARQGSLTTSDELGPDKITVVYEHGDPPPKITVEQTARKIQTVLADGVAVAVVASADGAQVSIDDVVLIERFSGNKRL